MLRTFFELLPEAQRAAVTIPAELANLDQVSQQLCFCARHAHYLDFFECSRRSSHQLKVLLDTLPDYHLDDEQPSYVMAIPCRPVLVALAQLLSGVPQGMQSLQHVNWQSLKDFPQ